MATFTERLEILISADAKGAAREIQGLGRTAERSLGSTENRIQQLSGQMVAFGSATLVAGGVAAAGLFKVAQAASNLSEAQNAANVTLGADGAAALQEYAETAAQTAGISQRAALEYGASFGLFVEKAGFVGQAAGDVSADLVQLAGDISSLRNVPIEESLAAIQSALAGETEAIRRFGIDISDATLKQEIFERTGKKVSGTLTQQQKVQEIINQLYEQGAVFADDFVNTSDSLANRQRALAAEFENTSAAVGEALLPAFEAVLGTAQGAFSTFNGLSDGTKQAVGGLAGIATTGALAAGGLALIVGGGLRTIDTFRELNQRVGNTAPWTKFNGAVQGSTGALSAFQGVGRGLALAGGIAAVVALGDALYGLTQNAEAAKAALNEFKALGDDAGFDAAFSAINRIAEEQLSLIDRLRQPVDGSDDILGINGEVLSNLTRVETVLENLFKANDTTGLEQTIGLLREVAELEVNDDIQPELEALADQYQRALDDVRKARDKDAAAADESTASTGANSGAMDDATDAADALKTALARLSATQKLNSLAFDVGKARADAFTEALERSTNADNLLKSGVSVGRALNDFKDTLGLIPDEAEDAADETDRVNEAMEQLRRVVSDTDPALSSLGISMGAAKAAASAFGQSLKNAAGLSDRAGSALDVGDSFRDFSRSVKRLPKDLDLVALTMGTLRPRARDAVRDILELGDSVRSYLETLLQSGASFGEVTSEAARFREELYKQLIQAGLTQEQADKYIRTLGLAPDQVETAIRLSGLEASRFKLNAYIQLLDGKIPPEIATQVIAKINADDLEGAAGILESFAQTNPQVIDVKPEGTKELEETKGTLQDLPRTYDALAAATGQYTDKQLDALDSVLGLGDAYRDFLGELVKEDPQKAIDFAQKLRDQFAGTVEGLGLTQDELNSYYQLLGIAEDQVVTSIELANFDATVFEITTVISLLQGIGELDPEVALAISDALLREDYEEVRRLLEGEVEAQLTANDEEARATYTAWMDYVSGNPPDDVPIDADTEPGKSTVRGFLEFVTGQRPTITVDVIAKFVDQGIGAFPIFSGPIGASAGAAGRAGSTRPGDKWDPEDGRAAPWGGIIYPDGGYDGDQRTPRANGGYVSGRGGPKADMIPAWLSNGEYVLQASAVRALGVDFLDELNQAGSAPARTIPGRLYGIGNDDQIAAAQPRYIPEMSPGFQEWERQNRPLNGQVFGSIAAAQQALMEDWRRRDVNPSSGALADFDPSTIVRAFQQSAPTGSGVTIERIDITETADARATGAELVRRLSSERFLRGAA